MMENSVLFQHSLDFRYCRCVVALLLGVTTTPYYIHHYHPLPHNHHNHHYLSSHKSKLTWGVQIIPRLRYRLVMEWNRIDILSSKFNPERTSKCFTPTSGLRGLVYMFRTPAQTSWNGSISLFFMIL